MHDGIGVLEFALCKNSVDLLKYASDLGLVKKDVSKDVLQTALEKGEEKVVKYLVNIFGTIDYAGEKSTVVATPLGRKYSVCRKLTFFKMF